MILPHTLTHPPRYPLLCRLGLHAPRHAESYVGRDPLTQTATLYQASTCQFCGRVAVRRLGPARTVVDQAGSERAHVPETVP
jgi:hypothetical protein